MNEDKYRVPYKSKIRLKNYDPNDTSLFVDGKKEAKAAMLKLNPELDLLQEQLYAEGKHKLLIILQAMDTGGKDGTIRSVFEGVNPQGVKVASFKTPTPLELSHDYLWRVHQHTPARGEIVIFNRSQYEDVLVVRVHELVPEEVWSKRYEQINAFEHMLTDEGTTVLKFYFHIDLQEQAKRFLARVEDPTKQWKFNPGDLAERERWADYMQAYKDMIKRTSTPWAPWYVIPANKKWYRNWLIAKIVIKTLKSLDMHYPAPSEDLEPYQKRLLEITLSEA
jgi:PPK2 family polyphosphate:nucleotide phosphotransferase